MSEPAQPSLLQPLLLFAAFGLFFYALIIRPQQRRDKEHKAMLSRLNKGDQVVTSGGLHGRVIGLTDDVLTLEVAQGVKVKIDRSAVGRRASAGDGEKS
jgi:preprotein translocase subunit YajC